MGSYGTYGAYTEQKKTYKRNNNNVREKKRNIQFQRVHGLFHNFQKLCAVQQLLIIVSDWRIGAHIRHSYIHSWWWIARVGMVLGKQ